MEPVKRPSPASDGVLAQLRMDLILRKWAPGSRLTELELAAHYGVSRGSLRTACAVLEKEGLLRTLPNGGRVAVGMDERYARDLFDARAMLEQHALDLLLEQPTLDYSPLLEALSLLKGQPATADQYPLYCQVDALFHRALLVMSGNRALLQCWDAISDVVHALLSFNATDDYKQDYVDTFIPKHQHLLDLVVTHDRSVLPFIQQHLEMGCRLSVERVRRLSQSTSTDRKD